LAAKLHKKEPKKFGDTNHKPEIAVALSKFESFVGFKPYSEIEELFNALPTLSRFTGNKPVQFDKDTLRELVRTILSASEKDVKEVYYDLKSTPTSKFGKHSYIPELLPRLAEQYSEDDNGILVALLTMNYLVLHKGEAIFIPTDGIHAYLSGDIVECMARSDNVLNTGFCPRADRDSVDTFVSALTFSPNSAEDAILKPKPSDKVENGHTIVLAPPMSEFNMLVTSLESSQTERIKALGGPSSLVVTSGSGTLSGAGTEFKLKEGYVFFIGCGTELELKSTDKLETHLAYCEA
jgi:mannose-6-phosphate isomerase